MNSPAPVLGVDGWKSGWLGALIDEPDVSFRYAATLADLVALVPEAAAVVVDVPIGLPLRGRRRADIESRRLVGPRASSVFAVPPRSVLEQPTYAEALALSREHFGSGISSQAFALRHKIFEADLVARSTPTVFEGHPEVSFAALKGSPLGYAKRTWNGQQERRHLLASAGIVIPDQLPPEIGRAPADDVLDAVVMAWTARRVADSEATTLPDPPEEIDGRRVAIWY
jgi:predicted RNase H-like nuclease